MATALQENSAAVAADPDLLNAAVSAVGDCLSMCGATARCVGVSTVPSHEPGRVTGLIGVHGDVSGFITVNMAETVARSTVGGLLQEHVDKLTSQVVDGVGEMTNIIAGGIKNKLSRSRWSFSHVTVPSVIIGSNYQIAYDPPDWNSSPSSSSTAMKKPSCSKTAFSKSPSRSSVSEPNRVSARRGLSAGRSSGCDAKIAWTSRLLAAFRGAMGHQQHDAAERHEDAAPTEIDVDA